MINKTVLSLIPESTEKRNISMIIIETTKTLHTDLVSQFKAKQEKIQNKGAIRLGGVAHNFHLYQEALSLENKIYKLEIICNKHDILNLDWKEESNDNIYIVAADILDFFGHTIETTKVVHKSSELEKNRIADHAELLHLFNSTVHHEMIHLHYDMTHPIEA